MDQLAAYLSHRVGRARSNARPRTILLTASYRTRRPTHLDPLVQVMTTDPAALTAALDRSQTPS